jgi:hypothetical protein
MTWLPMLCHTLLERLTYLSSGRSGWLKLTLAATALPAILLLFGGPASAGEPRCPRGQHITSGHCCEKGSEWTFFGCQEPQRQNERATEESQECPIGQERRAGMCWDIHCAPGEELSGNMCIPQTTCAPGQTGSPPFCHY